MRITKEHIGKRIIRINKFGKVVNAGVVKDVYEYTAESRDSIQLKGSGFHGPHLWQDSSEYGAWELAPEEPTGLSLLEAIQSGRPFRPVNGQWPSGEMQGWFTMRFDEDNTEEAVMWLDAKDVQPARVSVEVLTARYELKPEPKKIEITDESLTKAINVLVDWLDGDMSVRRHVESLIRKELGL